MSPTQPPPFFTSLKNFHSPSLSYTPFPKNDKNSLLGEMTRIMPKAFANGLPTTGERQEFGIIL